MNLPCKPTDLILFCTLVWECPQGDFFSILLNLSLVFHKTYEEMQYTQESMGNADLPLSSQCIFRFSCRIFD